MHSQNRISFIIAYKISPNSYRICWLGDCDCIEFRRMDTKGSRGSSACLAVLLGLILFSLSIGAYYSSSTDIFICYVPFYYWACLVLSWHSLFFSYILSWIHQFRDLMRKTLCKKKGLFFLYKLTIKLPA